MSLGRSHASDLQKRPSQQFLLSPNASPTAVPPSALFPSGAESLLRLVQPQAVNLKRISSRVQLKNKRGVLQDTEERVFSEVLELIEQIDTLRAHILTAREDIRELQVSHPEVEEQVRFHGYGQRLTQQQCGDLEEENLELVRQIEQIEARQVHSLDQVLQIERQKYDDLKAELADSNSHSPKQLEQKVKQLRDSIVELQNSRTAKVRAQFPEFEHLRLSNEELRQKTLAQLRGDGGQEAQQLRDYLQSDEESRAEFMEELKKFKGAYNRLKAENETLRERIARRNQSEAKENSNVQYRSKAVSNKSLDVESQIKRRGGGSGVEKLREYESHIRMMQNLKG